MSYSAASQVAARQLEFFENRKVLVAVSSMTTFPPSCHRLQHR